ncbi:uncharacterized protein TNIN_142771 [Trichonephila inaurata madagascariensis]|uniref:Mutator-like transposase domain-containing protein n=1 Tax=Trichonephila inaurata madagascariensis TaxID=2747483 RepID=A0A8X6IJA4_9ARAC|nr:uncharacterized protein TNIN_142771 [Trichonephila inaurata madagascariensis]
MLTSYFPYRFYVVITNENIPYEKVKVVFTDIVPKTIGSSKKEHNIIATAWEKVAEKEMYRAALEEKQLAVQAGEVGPDGFPMLTVVVDGCWAKRSYRNNYSSLSGAV